MSRLIDADDLINGYRHMGYDPTEHPEESYMEGWCKGFNAAVEHCTSHVIHAQTIEPKRIKGSWIQISPGGIYECSICGKYVMTPNIYAYDYCHGCGNPMEVIKNGNE